VYREGGEKTKEKKEKISTGKTLVGQEKEGSAGARKLIKKEARISSA